MNNTGAECARGDVFLIEKHYWRYAIYRAYFNLISEASRYYLGWLWWFLEPVAMTGVFYVVFTYIRPSNMENFTYFILIGVTMWLWFSNGVGNSTASLFSGRGIILQIRLPKLMFPLISVASATLKQGFVFMIVLIVMGLAVGPSGAWLYLPLLAFAQFLLILAVASTVAIVCCYLRDLRFIVSSGLTLMMFCSGLFFSIDRMPVEWQPYFRLNPMAVMLEQYRLVLLYQTAADLVWCLKIIAGSTFALYLIKWTFERMDLTLTRRVIDS